MPVCLKHRFSAGWLSASKGDGGLGARCSQRARAVRTTRLFEFFARRHCYDTDPDGVLNTSDGGKPIWYGATASESPDPLAAHVAKREPTRRPSLTRRDARPCKCDVSVDRTRQRTRPLQFSEHGAWILALKQSFGLNYRRTGGLHSTKSLGAKNATDFRLKSFRRPIRFDHPHQLGICRNLGRTPLIEGCLNVPGGWPSNLAIFKLGEDDFDSSISDQRSRLDEDFRLDILNFAGSETGMSEKHVGAGRKGLFSNLVSDYRLNLICNQILPASVSNRVLPVPDRCPIRFCRRLCDLNAGDGRQNAHGKVRPLGVRLGFRLGEERCVLRRHG